MDMNGQPGFLSYRERRVTFALVIGLLFLSCATWSESKGATNTIGTQTQHDIPPEIAIDVGSLGIETDIDIRDATSLKKGRYKDQNKHVTMMLIKIFRSDDGTILYQNVEPDGTSVAFTTTGSAPKKVTIMPGQHNSKKTLELDSTTDLTYSTINHPTRGHRLDIGNYAVANITITKPNNTTTPPSTTTLFSYDTPPANAEYPDRRYRVLIRVEKK